MITKNKIKLVSNNKLKQKGGIGILVKKCKDIKNPTLDEIVKQTKTFYNNLINYLEKEHSEYYDAASEALEKKLLPSNNENDKSKEVEEEVKQEGGQDNTISTPEEENKKNKNNKVNHNEKNKKNINDEYNNLISVYDNNIKEFIEKEKVNTGFNKYKKATIKSGAKGSIIYPECYNKYKVIRGYLFLINFFVSKFQENKDLEDDYIKKIDVKKLKDDDNNSGYLDEIDYYHTKFDAKNNKNNKVGGKGNNGNKSNAILNAAQSANSSVFNIEIYMKKKKVHNELLELNRFKKNPVPTSQFKNKNNNSNELMTIEQLKLEIKSSIDTMVGNLNNKVDFSGLNIKTPQEKSSSNSSPNNKENPNQKKTNESTDQAQSSLSPKDAENNANEILLKISKLELQQVFLKNMYRSLNSYFKAHADNKTQVEKLELELLKDNKLNFVVFSKIMHGKLTDKWPSKDQIEVLNSEMPGPSMGNRMKSAASADYGIISGMSSMKNAASSAASYTRTTLGNQVSKVTTSIYGEGMEINRIDRKLTTLELVEAELGKLSELKEKKENELTNQQVTQNEISENLLIKLLQSKIEYINKLKSKVNELQDFTNNDKEELEKLKNKMMEAKTNFNNGPKSILPQSAQTNNSN